MYTNCPIETIVNKLKSDNYGVVVDTVRSLNHLDDYEREELFHYLARFEPALWEMIITEDF